MTDKTAKRAPSKQAPINCAANDESDVLSTKNTARGFVLSGFVDKYGQSCSLQESSCAEEPCVWFGVDNPAQVAAPDGQVVILSRMHLTQDQVKALLPHLQHFAETGALPELGGAA
ncbi:hypothetical protein SAMN04515647_4414 [Cohaesibacter sp. ES.047]|uniref:hypothetical protein n=1 Tax=Cohaesibacter sp. ES.047 TaxID=1798205 RepID=UPI000BBF8907|nr:hypothetical protein [Cohaesibacter sp. ES.047]SNY94091.1 hypothetical protein SAMN04515647_4414 [Cohaesibacter sp. ES.047]